MKVLYILTILLSSAACSKSDKSIQKHDQKIPVPTSQEFDFKTLRDEDIKNLKYEDIKIGNGLAVTRGLKVTLHYRGFLMDGTAFDSSYKNSQPLSFTVGSHEVIEGWELGVMGMKEGGKRWIVLPPYLAYGEKGVVGIIPPNAPLAFEFQLLKVEQAMTNSW